MNQHVSLDKADDSLWSPWGDRLLAWLSGMLVIGLALAWMQVFYLGQPINEILSFPAEDSGLLGEQAAGRQVLGVHVFGDFQALHLWGADILGGAFPAQPPPYLPVSYAYGALFSVLSPWAAVVVHQLVSVGLVLSAGLVLLRGIGMAKRIVILSLTVFLTVPMVAALDTGNTQALILGLLMWSVVLLRDHKVSLAWLVLGFAISMKGYPALLLVWPLAIGMWRFALKALAVAFGINIALFVFLPGGPILNLTRYFDALVQRPGLSMIDAESSLRSLAAKVISVIGEGGTGEIASNPFLIIMSSMFWIGLSYVILRSRKLPQWAAALLTLSSLQMAVPTTYNYALGGVSLAAIWFGCGRLILGAEPDESNRALSQRGKSVLRWTAMLAIAGTLAPIGFRMAFEGVVVNVSTVVSPFLMVVFVCASVLVILLKNKSAYAV